ncbi:MAG TPA: MerR family transcriptional regulator [Chitinophagaceae bacterium]|jgi:DNA-binding transcriptional MerR regulator
MRQLDLFQPVENIKPQSDTSKGKVNGGMNAAPVQPTKSRSALNEPEPTRIVETKEEEKTEKQHFIQKEPAINGKRGRKSFKEMDADLVMVEVPDDEILFQKKYYAISEVAQWFHVNASLLRYWENEFDVLKPRKTRKGDRLFRPEDVKNLQLIYFLLRHRKFSIEGAKQYLKENKKKADVQMQLIQSLTKFRAFLLEWKANLGT